MIVDFRDLEGLERYKLISNTVIPRRIAWIITEDEGVVNVAPFSFFTPLSSDPATLIVSIGHKSDGTKKDSLNNILKTRKAVVCFVKEEHKDLMNTTSKELPKDISEAEHFQIETERILEDYPPIIQEVQGAFFCDFLQIVHLDGKTVPVVLEIKSAFYDDNNIASDLKVDIDNIGRVGKSYGKIVKI